MSLHAIIAGVGPGIGLSVSRRFAKEGFHISMIARQESVLSQYSEQIRQSGGSATGYPTDLCDLDALRQTFDKIKTDQGTADVLIYNAARWHEAKAMELDPMTFNWDIALCATGALACAQLTLPMMQRDGTASMIFTGGGLALYPEYGAGVASLTAGKSALRGLVFAMAPELAEEYIHVAMVTIAGQVSPGTSFDPDAIAEQYWRLHRQKKEDWQVETIFDGKSGGDT